MEACVGSWHSWHRCPPLSSCCHGQQTYPAPQAVHLAACRHVAGSQHGMWLCCSHLSKAMSKQLICHKSRAAKGWGKRWLYKRRGVCNFTTRQHDSSTITTTVCTPRLAQDGTLSPPTQTADAHEQVTCYVHLTTDPNPQWPPEQALMNCTLLVQARMHAPTRTTLNLMPAELGEQQRPAAALHLARHALCTAPAAPAAGHSPHRCPPLKRSMLHTATGGTTACSWCCAIWAPCTW